MIDEARLREMIGAGGGAGGPEEGAGQMRLALEA